MLDKLSRIMEGGLRVGTDATRLELTTANASEHRMFLRRQGIVNTPQGRCPAFFAASPIPHAGSAGLAESNVEHGQYPSPCRQTAISSLSEGVPQILSKREWPAS